MSSGFFGGGMAKGYAVGQLIDLPYMPSPIPRGFAHWDGSVHIIADFPRVYGKIGQTFRRVGDVFDITTHFRMGGGEVLRKGAGFTPAGVTPYPLDDDGTLAAAFGYSHLPMIAPDLTAYSRVLTGAGGTAVRIALSAHALSTGSFPLTAVNQEFSFTCTDFPPAADYQAIGVTIVYQQGGAPAGTYAFNLLRLGGVLMVAQTDNTQTILAGSAVGQKLGFYVTPAGRIGLKINDVDQGLTSATVPAGKSFIPVLHVSDGAAFGAPGATVGGVLDMSPMMSYPASSNVGQRGGSDTTAGHALTIPEIPSHSHDYAGPGAPTVAWSNPAGDRVPGGTVTPTSSVGGGAAHTHAGVDPLHDTCITLVRV